uniref:Secreted protein n=1 Tax=Esox lucius TaxID=8010 RepID=A0AAY5KP83_ESOLU
MLRKLVSVALRLNVQVKVVVVRYGVGTQRVSPHVWVEGILYWKPGTWDGTFRYLHGNVGLRERGRVVVDIHHLDFHAEELEWVLQKHFEMQIAWHCLPAYLFSIDSSLYVKIPVLQVHVQVRVSRARHVHLDMFRCYAIIPLQPKSAISFHLCFAVSIENHAWCVRVVESTAI